MSERSHRTKRAGTCIQGAVLFVVLAVLAMLPGCATGGEGSNPPLTNGTDESGDDAAVSADDASVGDDATPSSPEGDASGSNCNDAIHGLAALFVQPPVACTSSTDCAAGSCCFVGPAASTCVMQ
jgi:hypothetical protein